MHFRAIRLSTYQKVIAMFLITMIPIYGISISISIMGSNSVKNEISGSMVSKLEFYTENLNDEITGIQNQQWQYLREQDLVDLSTISETMDDFQKISKINKIMEWLMMIKNSSTYIKNTGVYINSLKKTISTDYGTNNTPNAEYEFLEQYLKSHSQSPVFLEQGKMFLIETFPKVSISSLKKPSIILYVEISVEKIEEVLTQFSSYSDSGTMLLDKKSGWRILSGKNTGLMTQTGNLLKADIKENGIQPKVQTVKLDNKSYLASFSELKSLNAVLISCIAENQILIPIRKFNFLFVILSVVSLLVTLLYAFSLNGMIHKPIGKLVNAFKMVEADNLNVSIQYEKNDEFGYMYRSFEKMVKRLKLSIEQVYERTIEAQKAELKQLQSQINPHFLYNSFYHIYRLSKSGNYDKLTLFSQKLGDYYQFVTRSGADEVPFEMEVMHAKNYADIQSMRFQDRIAVEFDAIPEESKRIMIPRLILQPVIENTYGHGLKDVIKDGMLYIKISFDKKVLRVSVEDNGRGMEDEELKDLQQRMLDGTGRVENTGIINVHRRIHLKFGQQSGLFLSRSEHGGIKSEIVIHCGEA